MQNWLNGIVVDMKLSKKEAGTLPQTVNLYLNAIKRSNILKPATFHSLRHSFAIQLLENGTDTRYVQELLGYENIRTTQRYTQVTNPALKKIKSPF